MTRTPRSFEYAIALFCAGYGLTFWSSLSEVLMSNPSGYSEAVRLLASGSMVLVVMTAYLLVYAVSVTRAYYHDRDLHPAELLLHCGLIIAAPITGLWFETGFPVWLAVAIALTLWYLAIESWAIIRYVRAPADEQGSLLEPYKHLNELASDLKDWA